MYYKDLVLVTNKFVVLLVGWVGLTWLTAMQCHKLYIAYRVAMEFFQSVRLFGHVTGQAFLFVVFLSLWCGITAACVYYGLKLKREWVYTWYLVRGGKPWLFRYYEHDPVTYRLAAFGFRPQDRQALVNRLPLTSEGSSVKSDLECYKGRYTETPRRQKSVLVNPFKNLQTWLDYPPPGVLENRGGAFANFVLRQYTQPILIREACEPWMVHFTLFVTYEDKRYRVSKVTREGVLVLIPTASGHLLPRLFSKQSEKHVPFDPNVFSDWSEIP